MKADSSNRLSPAQPPVADPTGRHWPRFMGVRQVAEYLGLNEKKVYALVAEGKLPATKITGKWLFPRELVDQWLLETSHGGGLTDRLILAGGDDPLLDRAVVQLANEVSGNALVSDTSTGTRLGLSLLARHRVDVCAIHWGPESESHHRHPGLIQTFPQHHDWVIVRLFLREQGLLLSHRLEGRERNLESLLRDGLRWTMRQPGAGSQRFLQETLDRHQVDEASLTRVMVSRSEREAAANIALGLADIAPGVHAVANEFSPGFLSLGWEAFDLVLGRRVYFRTLFQRLLCAVQSAECQAMARSLTGYDLTEHGRLIWAGTS